MSVVGSEWWGFWVGTFDHTPRNEITSFSQWRRLKQLDAELTTAEQQRTALHEPEKLAGFRGQVVEYPPLFLSDQKKRSATEVLSHQHMQRRYTVIA